MPAHSSNPGGASRVRRRALLGTAVLVVLVALAGLLAFLTRNARAPSTPAPHSSSATPRPSGAVPSASPPPQADHRTLPRPPKTHDPIVYGKAAAAALWSYDTRAYSQQALLSALRGWMTGERKYVDTASVAKLVPSPVLWEQMADNGQRAKGVVNEGHLPDSFTRALQDDPGAITQTYLYAVTVSGKQSIAWKGSPAGGAESRVITLAVQCRSSSPCTLAGVLPAVAP
ncbi:hypothetical protein AB0407_36325 [Streptomyces microflavus]|uniref:hypothetical protein n=1 Tax=Streptomyces microflavus TaxID=1919 RepID=UPI0034500FB9